MKKEFNILNYFNTRALFMGVGLSRILANTNEYSFLAIILGTIIGLVLLYLLRIEMKSSFFNTILNSVIIVMSLVILINMISTMYLTQMPKFLIGLPFTLLLLYLLNKDEKVLFRLTNILLFFNLVYYFLSLFPLLKYFSFSAFNYTNTNISNVFVSAIEFALFSITPTLFTRTSEYKDVPIYKMYIISSITMGVIFMLTYGILGPELAGIVRYPEYLILKEVSISSAIQNIENIVSYMWIIDIFMLIASCGNSIKHNLKNPKMINIIFIVLLFITSYMNQHYEYILVIYQFSPIILGSVLFLVWLCNKKLIFKH